MKTKTIEMHNDAMGELMGIKTEANMKMFEIAMLKPKKKKNKQSGKLENSDESYAFNDKEPRQLKQVITEVLNSLFFNQKNDEEIHRYTVIKTDKNIVISAKNIMEGLFDFSIIVFKDIDRVQKFEHQKQL
jgi:hypothetical protein